MNKIKILFISVLVFGSVTFALGQTTTVVTTTTVEPTTYNVPLLGISSFGKDAKTAVLHWESGDLKGLDAEAHLHRHDNQTTVRVKFNDMKKVSPTKRFVLWAYSPDGQYTRLGQVYNYKNRDEAKIDATTSLSDFGLLMTVEDSEVTVPTSTVWQVFKIS